jgi:hypothetical protein
VFGAHQVVSFANEDQGNVSCLEEFTFTYVLSIPISLPGNEDTIIITEGFITTNLTDDFRIPVPELNNGLVLSPSNPSVTIEFTTNIDLRVNAAYTTRLSVRGETQGSGIECDGIDDNTFFVDGPLSDPSIPTCPD